MRAITGLRPDIVPHQQWALSSWFYAKPLWYYHRLGPSGRFAIDQPFYQLIDPDLQPLCQWLHSQGLQTTPSCQGHFYAQERFEPVWDQLGRDRVLVRTAGLLVRDCQTHQPFLWQEPSYNLPWMRFGEFYAQAAQQQSIGYLGVLVPRDRPRVVPVLEGAGHRTRHAALFYDEHLSRLLGGWVFDILVRGRDPAEQSHEWQRITHLLQERLRAPWPPDSLQSHFAQPSPT